MSSKLTISGPLLILSFLAVGCGASSVATPIGTPRAPRAENCDVRAAAATEFDTGHALHDAFEVVGALEVPVDAATLATGADGDPTDPTVRAEAHALACRLGGEYIAHTGMRQKWNKAGDVTDRVLEYKVYAHRQGTRQVASR